MSIYEFLFNLVHVDPLLCATMALVIVAVIFAIAAFRRSGKRRDEALILQCMTHYNDVRRVKANAIMTGSQSLAEVYYANLFDLMWVEFKLWLEGRVNNGMMLEWMNARYADYTQNDGILVSRTGPGGRSTRRVSYPEEWDKRARSMAAGARRPAFYAFMDLVHEGELQKAINGKRRFRKNSSKPAKVKTASVTTADPKKHAKPQSPVAEPAGVVMESATGTASGAGPQAAGGRQANAVQGSAQGAMAGSPAGTAAGSVPGGVPGFMQEGVVVQVPTQESAPGFVQEAGIQGMQGQAAPGTIYVAPTSEAVVGGVVANTPGASAEGRAQDRAG